MARQPLRESWLIFVDTNIFLDFYRQGGEAAERQLKALERHKDSLIICEQVWMEFLKNRQTVIISNLKQIQKPSKVTVPPILLDFDPTRMLTKRIAEATEYYEKVVNRVEKILNEPAQHDPVYKAVARIFRSGGKFNLKRPSKERFEIRNLARKRFVLGYPPRKKNDTSIGDSINWEWIVRCAESSNENHHILIVSRDGDYGDSYRGESILNDWLYREFKDRVSKKRKIELTSKLTLALERLDEEVAEEDIVEEEAIIKSWRPLTRRDLELALPDSSDAEFIKRLLEESRLSLINI